MLDLVLINSILYYSWCYKYQFVVNKLLLLVQFPIDSYLEYQYLLGGSAHQRHMNLSKYFLTHHGSNRWLIDRKNHSNCHRNWYYCPAVFKSQGTTSEGVIYTILMWAQLLISFLLYDFVGKQDVFGEHICRYKTVGKSSCNVRALTYCDLHKILREDLIEVLEMYPEFAENFEKNLEVTYNLRDVSLSPL